MIMSFRWPTSIHSLLAQKLALRKADFMACPASFDIRYPISSSKQRKHWRFSTLSCISGLYLPHPSHGKPMWIVVSYRRQSGRMYLSA